MKYGEDSDIEFKLLPFQTGIFELYKDSIGVQNRLVERKAGNANQQLLFQKFDHSVGYYYVVGMDKEEHCKVTYDQTLTINRVPQKVTIWHNGPYCSDTDTAEVTLKIYPTESDVAYRLIDEQDDVVLTFTEALDDTLYYHGTLVAGIYRVQANIGNDSKCIRTFDNSISIDVRHAPSIGEIVEPQNREYCAKNLTEPLRIVISSALQDVKYELYREIVFEDNPKLLGDKIGYGGQLVFGQYSDVGNYYILANDPVAGCSKRFDIVKIVDEPKLVQFVGSDTLCEGEMGMVKLFGENLDPLVNYGIYSSNGYVLLANFSNYNGDTLYCEHNLRAGKYLIKGVVADCSIELEDTLYIGRNSFPKLDDLFGNGNHCFYEAPVTMGIKSIFA